MMTNTITMRILVLILFITGLFACQPKVQNQREQVPASHPGMSVWKGFNFADTSMIHRPEVTEQRFSTFLALLHRLKREEQGVVVSQFLKR